MAVEKEQKSYWEGGGGANFYIIITTVMVYVQKHDTSSKKHEITLVQVHCFNIDVHVVLPKL